MLLFVRRNSDSVYWPTLSQGANNRAGVEREGGQTVTPTCNLERWCMTTDTGTSWVSKSESSHISVTDHPALAEDERRACCKRIAKFYFVT